MFRWLYILPHLLIEANAARRDARIRFLKAEVEILRRKLGGNRVIPSPDDRARLLALGTELNHNVSDLIDIVTPQTFSRWVVEQREGRQPRRVGRPRIVRNVRALIKRLAKENAGWATAASLASCENCDCGSAARRSAAFSRMRGLRLRQLAEVGPEKRLGANSCGCT